MMESYGIWILMPELIKANTTNIGIKANYEKNPNVHNRTITLVP